MVHEQSGTSKQKVIGDHEPGSTVTSQIGPFAVIPVWCLTVGLTGSELATLVALRSFANGSGDAWPMVRTIAQRAGVSENTVKKAVATLRTKGMITTTLRYYETGCCAGSTYHLTDVQPPSEVTSRVTASSSTKTRNGGEGGRPAPLTDRDMLGEVGTVQNEADFGSLVGGPPGPPRGAARPPLKRTNSVELTRDQVTSSRDAATGVDAGNGQLFELGTADPDRVPARSGKAKGARDEGAGSELSTRTPSVWQLAQVYKATVEAQGGVLTDRKHQAVMGRLKQVGATDVDPAKMVPAIRAAAAAGNLDFDRYLAAPAAAAPRLSFREAAQERSMARIRENIAAAGSQGSDAKRSPCGRSYASLTPEEASIARAAELEVARRAAFDGEELLPIDRMLLGADVHEIQRAGREARAAAGLGMLEIESAGVQL
jgi:hypothetical protein